MTQPRATILVALALGCGAPPPSPSSPSPAISPSQRAPARLDQAAAIARAHVFLAAVDRRDAEAMMAVTTTGFMLLEMGSVFTPETLRKSWAQNTNQARPALERSCTHERTHHSDGAVVYIADCKEHRPAYADHAAWELQGWNTVVLVPEDGAWKVALWQWQKSGVEVERERWNGAYRRGTAFTKLPTKLLVEAVADTTAGEALVVAMGQGRNALYLASQGWRVTGIDIADEGLREARKTASENGLTIAALQADANKYDFGQSRWDLVTMLYATGNKQWIRRIQTSIKPGGLFVLEFFKQTKDEPEGVDQQALSQAFAGWHIVKNIAVEATADWGKRSAVLVRFIARKPR